MAQIPSLTYIGHATVLIEMNGRRILTDPILRNRVSLLKRRGQPVDPVMYQDVDAILISHLHYDHVDLPSLRKVRHDIPLIVPSGSARFFQRHGFRFIEELQINETTHIGDIILQATYAKHSPARHPFGLKTSCLGYIISGSYQIYFPGDTDLFPEMTQLSDNLDVALLPVWGWGPTLGPGHMDPLQAAKTLPLLQPRLAIPIHWGSLHLWGLGTLNPRRFLTDPPHAFVRHAARLAPQVKTQIVEPSETISIEQALSQRAKDD